ncbi:MAG: enolase C-terminal domain-like protein [Ilumatobacteraceae bacterium]|nr:enolase C-terminal domain-like protein [Ilumatobacteraceae bacterium]
MIVTDLRATAVSVPRRAELLPKTAHGEVATSEYVIVEVFTDAGLVGLGEVTCAPGWNGEEHSGSVRLLRGPIAETLRGSDPTQWRAVLSSIGRASRNRPFLRAAVEMACLDLAGKATGRSVSELLGGIHRTSIETKIVLPARAADFVAKAAIVAIDNGARNFKVKVGLDVDDDLERVRGVREIVGPDAPITVDANEGWTAEQARRAVTELAALGVEAIEQPIARGADMMCRDLRTASAAAIVADESIWTTADAVRLSTQQAFDVWSIYPGKLGGSDVCAAVAEIAAATGVGIAIGSNLELGIGSAMMAHVAALLPALSPAMPADIIGPLYFEHSIISDASFVRWDGVNVPTGPGLGVEIDADALAHFAIE